MDKQPDLFTTADPHELAYAEALQAHVLAVEQFQIDNGIIPPHIEADFLLDKAERRLLTLIDEHAGYIIKDDDWHVTPYGDDGARRVSGFTRDMDMLAEVNARAVLNAALKRGLVTSTRKNHLCGTMLSLTKRGRWYLDIVQHDDGWGEMED